MKKGQQDIARIHAQNAIRKQQEKLNLLNLASRVDAVAGRVNTAATMQTVTGSMAKVVNSMNHAMNSMNLEKVRSLPCVANLVLLLGANADICVTDHCCHGFLRQELRRSRCR
jgi:division protein CdvB (Snf7/Vps24/ESCRT-III family)